MNLLKRMTGLARDERGFTLIELVTVMTVLAILATISIPSYKRYQISSKETVLRENLYLVRSAIDAYYADRGAYPDALDDLVTSKYIRALPMDPFTGENDSWLLDPPEVTAEGELPAGGIFDIHSGSDLVGLNGIPLQDW